MPSSIRWRRKDYISLGKSVAKFNRELRNVETETNRMFLPQPIQYKELKGQILTRDKFNETLRRLKSFNAESSKLVTTQTKQIVTRWEAQENERLSARAEKNLFKQEKEISRILQEAKNKNSRISAKQQQELKLQYLEVLENLRDIRAYREGSELSYIPYKKMIKNLGDVDYKMLKATSYRQNFEMAVQSFKNLKGYELLESKLNRIKNPLYFYHYTRRSEYLKDIFVHYREGEGVVLSGKNTSQNRFYQALEHLGLVNEEKNKLIRKYKKQNNIDMLKRVEGIETAEDLIQFLDL